MAQHTTTPSTLFQKVNKWVAEFVTPSAHKNWRWNLKNCFLRKAGLTLGKGVVIDQGFYWFLIGGGVVFEDHVAIGKDVSIYNFGDVRIGKFAMFASDVLIANGGHEKNTLEPFSGPIKIGNGVWIGAGAKIVGANITVGDNAIVGAGALVIQDVPAESIVVGVPAKVIGKRDLPEKVWHLGGSYFCPRTFRTVT